MSDPLLAKYAAYAAPAGGAPADPLLAKYAAYAQPQQYRDVSDDELVARGMKAKPVDPNAPGVVESTLRGIGSGVTLGFDDEIGGAAKSLFSDKTYQQERDELRAKKKAAQEANPLAFGLGEVGGGLATAVIPGLGAAGAAKSLGGALKAGAAVGAAAGLGNSEADLTKGDVGGALLDAGTGAALGAGAGGLGYGVAKGAQAVGRKAVETLGEGAEERVRRADLGALTKGAPKGMRDRIVGQGGKRSAEVGAFLEEHGVGATGAPEKALDAVEAVRKKAGAVFGRVDSAVEDAVGGISPSTASDALEQVAADFKKQGSVAGLRAVEKIRKDAEVLGEATGLVPVSQFRGFVSNAADAAYEAAGTNPKLAKRVEQKVVNALGKVLRDHIDEAAAVSPEIAALAKDLPAATRDFGIAKDLGRALAYRVQAAQYPATGLRDIAHKAARLPALVFGGPKALAADLAIEKGAPMVYRAANKALAKLYAAAQTGNRPAIASAAEEALAAGAPRGVIAAALGRLGDSMPQAPALAEAD